MNRREAQKTQVLNQLAVFDQAWAAAAKLEVDVMPMMKEHADTIDTAGLNITLESILLSVYWRLIERLALHEGQ